MPQPNDDLTPFRQYDASSRPQRVFIKWTRVLAPDETADAPDKMQDGFWPSANPQNAGYVGAENVARIEDLQAEARARMSAWRIGAWCYVGVRAIARAHVPIGGTSFVVYTFVSPGVWGVESDSDEAYLDECFEEQKVELREHLQALGAALVSGDFDEGKE